ncbi:hypothetical protein Adt_12601 [Abeliophyllum distichum]|uniref:Uncharacterized protein n=1 Tax=Abeliophyllum distichum TaxID=126358 RepID=A0ABD1UR65_9LAMI
MIGEVKDLDEWEKIEQHEMAMDFQKAKCLGFLLDNHPVLLLHPYTKEWKVKLEEMELGCDPPDEDDDNSGDAGENQIVDWIEEATEEKLLDAMCLGVGWEKIIPFFVGE